MAGVLTALEEAGILGQTLVVVMADHGGHGHTHGTDSADDMTIPVIFSGAGVRPNQVIASPVSYPQHHAYVAHSLGLPVPPHWHGRIIAEVDGG